MLLNACPMTFRLSPSTALALAVSVASVVLFTPSSAHAGCEIECTAIRNTGVTITPPLDCLTLVGAPDDNSCVCASTQTVRNDCSGAVQWTSVPEAGRSCSPYACAPVTVARGGTFEVEVRDNASRDGQRRTDAVSAKFTVIEVDDAARTEHTIEITASADIDPDASACSTSQGPARGGAGALALGVGAAIAATVRRRRLAR
jgi:predicted RNA-binding protein with TRAM domain